MKIFTSFLLKKELWKSDKINFFNDRYTIMTFKLIFLCFPLHAWIYIIFKISNFPLRKRPNFREGRGPWNSDVLISIWRFEKTFLLVLSDLCYVSNMKLSEMDDCYLLQSFQNENYPYRIAFLEGKWGGLEKFGYHHMGELIEFRHNLIEERIFCKILV